MTSRTFTEIECEHCGQVERRQQARAFVPPGWRELHIGYRGMNGTFVLESVALICSKCTEKIARIRAPEDGENAP